MLIACLPPYFRIMIERSCGVGAFANGANRKMGCNREINVGSKSRQKSRVEGNVA